MPMVSPEAKTARILLVVLAVQGSVVVWSLVSSPVAFLKYIGYAEGSRGPVVAWLVAALIALAYVWGAAKISVVRQHMFNRSGLKLLAIVTAAAAGILEEVVFRKWVMDYVSGQGYGPTVQVLASGASFGVVHLAWGVKSVSAGVNAVLSTALLGIGLALVYLLADRSLAPCIAAHFVVTGLIEPGLLLAAIGNQLGYWHERVA